MNGQTSALDTYTEQALLQNINSILKEKRRTSVFVAHRLRTIYDCDQILVLKEGQVAEKGSHRDLLEQNGIYAELWNGKRPAVGSPEGVGVFQTRKLTKSCATAQEMSLAQDVDSEPTAAEEEESTTKK